MRKGRVRGGAVCDLEFEKRNLPTCAARANLPVFEPFSADSSWNSRRSGHGAEAAAEAGARHGGPAGVRRARAHPGDPDEGTGIFAPVESKSDIVYGKKIDSLAQNPINLQETAAGREEILKAAMEKPKE